MTNIIDNIKNIISSKKTNICLAADVDNVSKLFDLINILGHDICILKIHYDIIYDFHKNLDDTIENLNSLKKRYNFLIWEDRKFSDIGFIMEKQINNHVSRWADLISIHPIAGKESVKSCLNNNNINIGIILIGEMSSNEQLTDKIYQDKVIQISEEVENVVGIVCQHKMTNTLLNIVPGISLTNNKKSKDGKGQIYSLPSDKQFADILVVGRSIYQSINPIEIINKYK